jgi:hypothetical protein
MDAFFVQRRLHRFAALGHWNIRSVCFGQNIGSISTALYPWAEERILYQDGILDVDM